MNLVKQQFNYVEGRATELKRARVFSSSQLESWHFEDTTLGLSFS